MNEIKRLEKRVHYTLSVEEIRAIQKEEIHKFIVKYIWAAVWVAIYLICNWVAFQFIADAMNQNIIELKALSVVFNFMIQAGFYQVINSLLKEGE